MEFGESKGQRSNNSSSSTSGTILRWDVWELNNHHNDSSRMDWATNPPTYATGVAAEGSFLLPRRAEEGSSHAPPLDPHLVCLKLGKRHYFEDHAGEPIVERRAVGLHDGGGRKAVYERGSAAVPRCQVEGCHVALVNVKDYHRRHKVCEVHSKAPKVVVLGLEQRFCQQCSRFHVVSEFEETKRSCKRRLAGHNERRRKNSHDSIARNPYHENKVLMMSGGGFPYTVTTQQQQQRPRAYTLLSSNTNTNTNTNAWVSPSDLSSRSSAALRELIAENRARQLDTWHHHSHLEVEAAAKDDLCSATAATSSVEYYSHHPNYPVFFDVPQGHGHGSSTGHVTLDLMERPTPEFVYVSGGGCGARTKAPKAEEDHFDFWNYS